jgi:hypothetical protein
VTMPDTMLVVEWRLCPFCGIEPSSPCEDDCPTRQPALKRVVKEVRELILLTESLYKRVAVDMSTDERLRIEDTLNGVFEAMGGIK